MTLKPVTGGRHICDLPRFIDEYNHRSGELFQCDDCERYWRLWLGGRYFDWGPVGWWESRKIRRSAREQLAGKGGAQ